MASDEANRRGKSGRQTDDAELSERLRKLGDRLGPAEKAGASLPETAGKDQGSDSQSLAKAMRLSSEFIAGILAGFGVGWLIDRLAGTTPWGMIVFLLLGFAAGVVNVMRSAGMLGGPGARKQ